MKVVKNLDHGFILVEHDDSSEHIYKYIKPKTPIPPGFILKEEVMRKYDMTDRGFEILLRNGTFTNVIHVEGQTYVCERLEGDRSLQ